MSTSKQPNGKSEPEKQDEEGSVIVLSGEGGEERSFQCLAMVDHEGKRYAVLAPADADLGDESDEEIELFLFEYEVDDDGDGDEIFSEIEDEATWNAVQAEAEKILLASASDHDA